MHCTTSLFIIFLEHRVLESVFPQQFANTNSSLFIKQQYTVFFFIHL